MLTYIENLRKKPEPERKKAVFRLTGGIMLVVVAAWAVILWFRLSDIDFSFDTGALRGNGPSVKETFQDRMEAEHGRS